MLVIVGIIIYNEIYVLPIPWFSYWTKAKIAEREGKRSLDDENSGIGELSNQNPRGEVYSTSPHSVNDSKRDLIISEHKNTNKDNIIEENDLIQKNKKF
jgi:hypothetical protein